MKRKKSSWHWPRGGGGREEVSHSSQAAAAKATFCILNDDVKRLYFFLLFMCITACPVHTGRSISEGSGSQRQHPLNITAVTGITVELKCKVKLHECGNFNGIEWYREPLSIQQSPDEKPSEIIDLRQRVYVYRHHSGISKPEGHWTGRARHIYDAKKHLMRVKLSPLKLEDEGAYSCEITYEEPGRWFKDSCQDPQMSIVNVLGKPEDVSVAMDNGTELQDGSILGPYVEGTNLVLRCKAEGGRPIPEVVWHDGVRELPNSWHWRVEHDNGTGSVQSEINIELSRINLGLPLICKVNSSALDAPITKKIHVNMEVAPNQLIMERPHDKEKDRADVPEGGRLSVTCIAKGAKPQAYIYWNSEPELSKDDIHEEVTREANGLTFQTLNRLTFSAQRELTSLSCFASNKALDERKGVHLVQSTTINVKFKPEVLLTPANKSRIIHAVEGEPLAVTCNFKANPMVGANIKWYKNGHLLENHPNKPSVGQVLNIEAGRASAGVYSCVVENEVGRSVMKEIAHVFVEEKPQVTIYFEPRQPVSETADANVTLMCSSNYNLDVLENSNVITGNTFVSVKWYLDGDMLKQVDRSPECMVPKNTTASSGSGTCHVDPSKVMLLNVRRSFRGNYSCQAQNRAGWGPISEPKEMMVLYPPEGTAISYKPTVILKDKPFEIKCAVKDPGFPPAAMVRWLHNGHEIKGRTDFRLSFNHADVYSSGNYSCVPFNRVGMAQPAATSIRIHSPPTFVQSLPPVSGIPYHQKSVQLHCVVQCFPLCNLVWHRNNTPIPILKERSLNRGGILIGEGSFDLFSKFVVRTQQKPPNQGENILEHVESTLTLDFHDWPGDQLTASDMTSYTCVSSANSMGSSVQSRTNFHIHYPPRNIKVSPRRQDVYEKATVEPFTCTAEAFPNAKYYWNFQEGNFTTIGPTLTFRHGIRRYQAGTYTCTAYNDLDKVQASVHLNVFYKPTCRIRNEQTIDGGLNLRCDVDAFPPNVTYVWTHNQQPISASNGPTLYYRHANSLLKKAKEGDLEAVNAIFGTFACQASNMAGLGEKCSISIDGPPSALVADTDTTYLIFGGAAVVLLLFIIVISIVLCRRHSVSKYETGINRVPETPLTQLGVKKGNNNLNNIPQEENNGSTPKEMTTFVGGTSTTTTRNKHSNGDAANAARAVSTVNTDNTFTSNGTYDLHHPRNMSTAELNTVNNGRSYDMYEMRPPPPMYRRVPQPPLPQPPTVTHMMTLDRRIPGVNSHQLQHQLIPNGCDVTLNRRHYSDQRHLGVRRRNPDELWLV